MFWDKGGAWRLIWMSRPMLVMQAKTLPSIDGWGKKEPMLTCSCLVVADPAI
jgi:hypothetical protein